MMKLNIELNKKTIILLFGIGLAILVFIIFIRPLFSKVSDVSREASTLDAELVAARDTLQRGKTIDRDKRLLSRNEVSRTINEIIGIGTDLNINILSTSPQKIEKRQGSKYPVLPIRMEVQSRYKDLGIFFGDLENLSKSVVTVKEFSIERREEILPKIQTELVIEIHLEEGQGG